MRSIMIGLLASLVLILILAASYFLIKSDISVVVGLPMLVVGAVVVMLCLLASMSVLYASFDLQDKTQALALPEGSIRAVIALMLIVLFAILAIYLFGSISSGQLTALDGLSEGQKDQVTQMHPGGDVISVLTDKGTYRVWVRTESSAAGVDFAKQLLILVGTLVTSISSFYFGTRSSGDPTKALEAQADATRLLAQKAAADQPAVQDPPSEQEPDEEERGAADDAKAPDNKPKSDAELAANASG
ncbi:hypothetical protein [Mesorhizobium sp. M0030]|uniref:hypothetical protein n=1 Tax=Mesorhizobium sp. M0030 TaxID=2956851 RepID=UPI00333D7E18